MTTPDLKPTAVTIRLPKAKLETWRDEYARTYDLHRMSLNTWLLSRIDLSFAIRDEAVNPPPA